MSKKAKTRSVREGDRDTPRQAPKALKRSVVQLPAVVDDDGQPTLEGFRSDERWMVRAYGD